MTRRGSVWPDPGDGGSRWLPAGTDKVSRDAVATFALFFGSVWALFTFSETRQAEIATESARHRFGLEFSLRVEPHTTLERGEQIPLSLVATIRNSGSVALLLNTSIKPTLVSVVGIDSLGFPEVSDSQYHRLVPSPGFDWTETAWVMQIDGLRLLEPEQAVELTYLVYLPRGGLHLFSLDVPIDETLLFEAARRQKKNVADLLSVQIPFELSEGFNALDEVASENSFLFRRYFSVP